MTDPLLNDLARETHAWARQQGFYDREVVTVPSPAERVENPSLVSEKLMLIVSEIAEVQDALRDDDRASEAAELADALIRILDYAGWRGIDLDKEVRTKMTKNRERPRLHGRTVF